MECFKAVSAYKCIYVMAIPDSQHRGLLKIGDAVVHGNVDLNTAPNSSVLNKAAKKRIDEYTRTAGIDYQLLYTELAVCKTDEGIKAFRDHAVHDVLTASGYRRRKMRSGGMEWFNIDLNTAKAAIRAVKKGMGNLSGEPMDGFTPIVLRPEQEEAVERTVRQFGKSKRMLWNAKMRFGKTLTALEVVKRMGFHRTIIMTHRPVVDDGWYQDFVKIFHGEKDFIYGSKSKNMTLPALEASGKRYVYFASIQDLRGSDAVGGEYDKNDQVFDTDWDCVIVDEAHEGTKTNLGENVLSHVVKTDTCLLSLSGTPFNIMDEYRPDETYTWDYMMEQRAKREWDRDHFGDSNPYEELPEMEIRAYDLGDVFKDETFRQGSGQMFSFAEFFRIRDDGGFVHEDDIRDFLHLLTEDDARTGSHYPFSRDEYRRLFRHTLWMVPGVREAKALKKLMLADPVFGCGSFDIVNVAGNEEAGDALTAVKDAIERAEANDGYTITLSCGRLTTGVTIPEWTGVLMLAGAYSTSASGYLQTIFRVQSPCNRNGRVKERAYVFDFAPDRTLKMVSQAVAATSGRQEDVEDAQALSEFLSFCPVIGIKGSTMRPYDASHMLQQLKRTYADRAVRNGFADPKLYRFKSFHLGNGDMADFNTLKKAIGEGTSAHADDNIVLNNQGLTDREKKARKRKSKGQATAEDEEVLRLLADKKNRKKAMSILNGVSVRMPLLIFGADVPYDDDITLDRFVELVDDRSWAEFMPNGVTKRLFRKFEKYYDEAVFVAAGHRIRDIAHEADELSVTERTMKVANLFACFRNPDKETVLTPWRVVNMHMSDMLGGWDFYDKTHTDQLQEPRFVDRGKVTRDVFLSRSSKVLEMNSKTGLYPLYVAYSMFRAWTSDLPRNALKDQQWPMWRSIVEERLFVICKTPMAKRITQRTLCGYREYKANTHCFKDMVGSLMNKPSQVLAKVSNGKLWFKEEKDMKFSAIVGNPPYQMLDAGYGSSATPIYQHFVKTAIALHPDYVSMITPSRWFIGGKFLDEFRAEMLSDHRLSKLVDFPKLYEPFPRVKIRGGVSYFLWDARHDGPCSVQTMADGKPVGGPVERFLDEYDVLVRRNEAIPILHKVCGRFEPTLDGMVSAQSPFGLPTNFGGGQDSREGLEHPVLLYANQHTEYVEYADIVKNADWVGKWKVLLTAVQGTSAAVETKFMSNPIIAGPDSACTGTYLVAGVFDSEEMAMNYVSYLKTRFVRFLISCRKQTQHASRGVYAFVPIVDWSHPWTDAQLYKRYGLSDEDVAFIEATVKPMD